MPFKSKEQKAQYNKEYYKKNKEPINKNIFKSSHNDFCVQCNKSFTTGYLSKHLQSRNHKNRVAELIKQQQNN